jgi:hypothetical protein
VLLTLFSGEETIMENLTTFPTLMFRKNPKLKRCWTITYINLHDLISFHLRQHPESRMDDWREVILSDDGVPESNSTSISYDCISVKFVGCRNIYPVLISRPEKGHRPTLERRYERLVYECNELAVKVVAFAADAPKRAHVRQTTQFNGTFGKHTRAFWGNLEINLELRAIVYRGHSLFTRFFLITLLRQKKPK